MTQIFDRGAELRVKLTVLALVLLAPLLLAWSVARESAYQGIGQPTEQPIPFSHKHHVGDNGIDCRFCHSTVETDRHAGMPGATLCLGCHAQLYRNAPMLQTLHDSVRNGKPIGWRAVHWLPDFVYFDHAPHVAKGVTCIECHGHVEQMPLTWRAQPLQMQWCLDCHRDPRRRLRPPSQVFETRERALAAETAAPTATALESRRRLTDCSTCHR